MNIIFAPIAWNQLCQWVQLDRKIFKKIENLIRDIQKNGLSKGIGKPEPLKHCGVWSRRITDEHRLIYNLDENKNLIIIACRGHYDD